MKVASNKGSGKIMLNYFHGYFMTSSQSAKKWKIICKNLYNFEGLSLLNKKTFFFDILVGNKIENEINSGFFTKMKFRGVIKR